MDVQTKMRLKGEIAAVKGLLPSAIALTGPLQQAAYPVTGPIVSIPSLPTAAQAIKVQNDCLLKIVSLLEKIVDES